MKVVNFLAVFALIAATPSSTFAKGPKPGQTKGGNTSRVETKPGEKVDPSRVTTPEESSRDTSYRVQDVLKDGVKTGGEITKERINPMPVVPPTAAGVTKPEGGHATETGTATAKPKSNAALSLDPRAKGRGQPVKTSVEPTVFKASDIKNRDVKMEDTLVTLRQVIKEVGGDVAKIESEVDKILASVGGKENIEAKVMLMETMAAEAKAVYDANKVSEGKEVKTFNSEAILKKMTELAAVINSKITDPKLRAQTLAEIVISYSDIPNFKTNKAGTGFIELALAKAIENLNNLDSVGLDGFLNLKHEQALVYNEARSKGASFAKARELARQRRLNMLNENGVALEWTDKDGKKHAFCECDGTCST